MWLVRQSSLPLLDWHGLLTAVGLAEIANNRGWGLLKLGMAAAWPEWTKVVVTVVAFDLLIDLQHVMFHAAPALRRLHMVHRADLDFDVTTGLRFHTIEMLLSALVKLATVRNILDSRHEFRGARQST